MFGKRLRTLRKESKLTMKEFGEKFSLAESTISGYENGNRKPDMDILSRFADFFNVSTDYLLGRTDEIIPVSKKFDSLSEINKLIREFGIEDFGFFDIDQWKKLSPEDIDELRRHFEWVAQKAKERNEEKN
ncbi:helix-turn-helix domain-containing protein [Niallia taxi]|uniref:helix-turn-helix domain-containing protein n=1 Tax=Niallia taxi TaxID=2499688 RepID=UPI00300B7524